MDIRPITLIGERSRLLPLDPSQRDELLLAAQHEGIWDYMPLRLQTAKAIENWIEESLKAQAAGTELPFAIQDAESGKLAGSTRFMDISKANRGLEIGWTWLTPAVWRTRINTECKYLLLKHCFEDLGAIRVQFKTDRRNVRSQNAIERIGATREGVLRNHRILPDGYIRDSVYFSILDSEWREVKSRLEAFLSATP